MTESHTITEEKQAAFLLWLRTEEKAQATIEKYGRDVRAFAGWLSGTEVTKDTAAEYKRHLLYEKGRAAAGVNGVIASLNAFFAFIRLDIKIKPLKIQKLTFRIKEKELTRKEYMNLLTAAKSKRNERLNLVIQTICSTGIRVSELEFITVEAVRSGVAEITNKGKSRTVFLPKKLKPLLLSFANERGILAGCIFVTRSGRPLHRSNIWADMKKICRAAGVEKSKVFPHNLRSLFAKLFYGLDRDVVKLADILGHSSVETTRIYLKESGETHRLMMDALGLVIA